MRGGSYCCFFENAGVGRAKRSERGVGFQWTYLHSQVDDVKQLRVEVARLSRVVEKMTVL